MRLLPEIHKQSDWVRDATDPRLLLHRPTGTYYVRAKKKGKKPLFKSTGFKTKGKAKTKALLLIAEWLGSRKPGGMTLFGDFASDYLKYIEKTKLKARTKEQARIYIGKLIQEMGYMNIEDINEGFFDEWVAEYKGKTDRQTFMDFAKYLSKVLRHAHRKEVIGRLPKIKNPDAPKETGRVYTHEEINRILEGANPKLELQIRLCLQSFMRLREMLHLRWDQINFETNVITLSAGDVKTGSKTGRGRSFHINPTIRELLFYKRFVTDGPKSPYVFPSPEDLNKPEWSNKTAWKTAKAKAGIEGKARWHDLRHTAISWALTEYQMNPLMVSEYAGVSLRTIQKVYLKVKPEHTKEVGFCIQI